MGNSNQGMSKPDPEREAREVYAAVVHEAHGRLSPDGSVDPTSIRLAGVVAAADERLAEEGLNPRTAPLARATYFTQVLEELRLPQEHQDRLETQYHFREGDGARRLAQVDGRLGVDGLPDPRSILADKVAIAAANQYRETAAVNSAPGTLNEHLGGILRDLRLPAEDQARITTAANVDEKHFSWLTNGQLPQEMERNPRAHFQLVDKALKDANTAAPALDAETQKTLLTHADPWGENIKAIFRNQKNDLDIHLSYPQADITRTAGEIGSSAFKKAVEAGYNLTDKGVMTAYCHAVMAQTTEFGHTTQVMSRAMGGREAEQGERNMNPSADAYGSSSSSAKRF
jgi:hypothetical protein